MLKHYCREYAVAVNPVTGSKVCKSCQDEVDRACKYAHAPKPNWLPATGSCQLWEPVVELVQGVKP